MRVKYEDGKIVLSHFMIEDFMFSLKGGPTSVSLGSMVALISQSFTCLQFCLLVYRLRLTFSPKRLRLWKNIGDIGAYALLFFLMMAGP